MSSNPRRLVVLSCLLLSASCRFLTAMECQADSDCTDFRTCNTKTGRCEWAPLPDQPVTSGFKMEENAFTFPNFGGRDADSTMSSELMQRMFGKQAVCASEAASCRMRPAAKEYQRLINLAMQGGRCEGFAIFSALMFQGRIDPVDFGAQNAAEVDSEDVKVKEELAYWFATQYLHRVVQSTTKSVSAEGAVRFLAQEFGKPSHPMYRLGIARIGNDGRTTGGHAVVPTGVVPKGDGKFVITVYDNNHPGHEREVLVDVNAGSWEYQASTNPDSQANLYVGNPSNRNKMYLAEATPRTGRHECGFCSGSVEDAQQVFAGSAVSMNAVDSSGAVAGEVDGVIVADIPDSVVVPFFTAENQEDRTPLQVVLPTGPVNLKIRSAAASTGADLTSDVRAMSGGAMVGLSDLDLGPDDEAGLSWVPSSGQVTYTPAGPGPATLLYSRTTTSGQDVLVTVTVPPGTDASSVTVGVDEETGNTTVTVQSTGPNPIVIGLTIVRSNLDREDVLEGEVELPPGGSAEANVEDWEGNGEPIEVSVDTDGDGVPDETRSVDDTGPVGLPPVAPSNLVATAMGSGLIRLTWADNSDSEDGFEIQRDSGAGFVLLATAPSNTTTYDDATVLRTSTYSYRIRAINPYGQSEFTAPSQATTPDCAPGWQDNDGDKVCAPACAVGTCNNHGTCSDVSGTATCVCDAGYTGLDCSACAQGYQDLDSNGTCMPECAADACNGRGSCSHASGEAVCTCDLGYAPPDCAGCAEGYQDKDGDTVCTPDCTGVTCSNHGTCGDGSGSATCVCNAGYTGLDCAACAPGYQDLDTNGTCMPECTGDTCNGRGTCSYDLGEAVCACDLGYAPPNCAVCALGYQDGDGDTVCTPDCTGVTCSNHGTCEDGSGEAICICASGYDGTACDTCEAGYALDGGATCQPCPVGAYCAGATEPAVMCGPGQHDDDFTSATPCAACAAGFFCEGGGSTPIPCPAGTWDDDADASTQCVECAPGNFCAGGAASPLFCVAGSSDDDIDPSTACVLCGAGLYCAGGVAPPVACTGEAVDGDGDPSTPCVERTFSYVWGDANDDWPVGSGLTLDVAVDPLRDDIYALGTYGTDIAVNGTNYTAPRFGGVVVSLNSAGGFRWSTNLAASAGGQDLNPVRLAVHPVNGDVVVIGSGWSGDALVGGTNIGALNGSSSPFIVRLSAGDGSVVWGRTFPDTTSGQFRGLDFDPLGDVVVAGFMSTSLTLDAINLTATAGSDGFLAVLDWGSGSVIHAVGISAGAGNEEPEAVAVLMDGSLAVVGRWSAGDADFNGHFFTLGGTYDGFFLRTDLAGHVLHAAAISTVNGESVLDVRAAHPGSGYIFSGVYDVDTDVGGTVLSGGGFGSFVARVNGNGDVAWVTGQTGGGNSAWGIRRLRIDGGGDVHFAAILPSNGSTFFGGQVLPNGPDNARVVTLDALTGAVRDLHTVTGSGGLSVNALGLTRSVAPVLVGYLGSPLTLDGVAVVHGGGAGSDQFVVRLQSRCGNGILDSGEQCDDGNLADGDGCFGLCAEEPGFFCMGEPSVCLPAVCGNSVIEGREQCDDGGNMGDDGCSPTCTVEESWLCTREPSLCAQVVCESAMMVEGMLGPSFEATGEGITATVDGVASVDRSTIRSVGDLEFPIGIWVDVIWRSAGIAFVGTRSSGLPVATFYDEPADSVWGRIHNNVGGNNSMGIFEPPYVSIGPPEDPPFAPALDTPYRLQMIDDGLFVWLEWIDVYGMTGYGIMRSTNSVGGGGRFVLSGDTGVMFSNLTVCASPGAVPWCGDGVTEGGELCDDANLVDIDECNNLCQVNQYADLCWLDLTDQSQCPSICQDVGRTWSGNWNCDGGMYPWCTTGCVCGCTL